MRDELADDPADLTLGGIGARADNSNALASEGVRMRIDRSKCGRTSTFAQSVSVVEQRPLREGDVVIRDEQEAS